MLPGAAFEGPFFVLTFVSSPSSRPWRRTLRVLSRPSPVETPSFNRISESCRDADAFPRDDSIAAREVMSFDAIIVSSIAIGHDILLFFLMICLDAIEFVLFPRSQQTLYRCGLRQEGCLFLQVADPRVR